jgi:hypothetical protein
MRQQIEPEPGDMRDVHAPSSGENDHEGRSVIREIEALRSGVRWRLLTERLRLEHETAELRKKIARLRASLVQDDAVANLALLARYARTSDSARDWLFSEVP